jgi:hypothetical protein
VIPRASPQQQETLHSLLHHLTSRATGHRLRLRSAIGQVLGFKKLAKRLPGEMAGLLVLLMTEFLLKLLAVLLGLLRISSLGTFAFSFSSPAASAAAKILRTNDAGSVKRFLVRRASPTDSIVPTKPKSNAAFGWPRIFDRAVRYL